MFQTKRERKRKRGESKILATEDAAATDTFQANERRYARYKRGVEFSCN